MLRRLTQIGAVGLLLAGLAASSQAQFRGWGAGTTAGGSNARGMGVFSAGAGAYNEQTAQARSINADTAMQMNEYMYQSQQRRNQQYYAHLAEQQQRVNESAATTYDRLHNQPEAADVHRGDALNVVLDELTDPAVYIQTVQGANEPLLGAMVLSIPFQYAAQAITISLGDLSSQGVPDVLLTSPAFANERTTLKALVAKARQELGAGGQGQVSAETLAGIRQAIKAVEQKVATQYPVGTPTRAQCDNWLKGMTGLTHMLQTPNIEQYLQGLKNDTATNLGELLAFMHTFNLRFGVASTPQAQATYDQLYPKLVALRDQVNPPARNPVTQPVSAPNPQQLTSFFSQMYAQQGGGQAPGGGGQAPAPPPPGR